MSFTYGFKDYTSIQHWCLLSRKTGNLYNFKSVSNDINPYQFNYPMTSVGNSFVSAIDYVEPDVGSDREVVDVAFHNFDEMSNPVLMIYTLKADL